MTVFTPLAADALPDWVQPLQPLVVVYPPVGGVGGEGYGVALCRLCATAWPMAWRQLMADRHLRAAWRLNVVDHAMQHILIGDLDVDVAKHGAKGPQGQDEEDAREWLS